MAFDEVNRETFALPFYNAGESATLGPSDWRGDAVFTESVPPNLTRTPQSALSRVKD